MCLFYLSAQLLHLLGHQILGLLDLPMHHLIVSLLLLLLHLCFLYDAFFLQHFIFPLLHLQLMHINVLAHNFLLLDHILLGFLQMRQVSLGVLQRSLQRIDLLIKPADLLVILLLQLLLRLLLLVQVIANTNKGKKAYRALIICSLFSSLF